MPDRERNAQRNFPQASFISTEVIDRRGMSGGDPPYSLKYSNKHFCWLFVRKTPNDSLYKHDGLVSFLSTQNDLAATAMEVF